jgi:hypothetical protein
VTVSFERANLSHWIITYGAGEDLGRSVERWIDQHKKPTAREPVATSVVSSILIKLDYA